MGTIYYGLGDYAKAAAAYEGCAADSAAQRDHPSQSWRRLHAPRPARGCAAAPIGRPSTQAEAEVSVSPSDARAIARLAVYQAKAGDDAAAMRSLQRALDAGAERRQVLLRAGVVHALAGRTDAGARCDRTGDRQRHFAARLIADRRRFCEAPTVAAFCGDGLNPSRGETMSKKKGKPAAKKAPKKAGRRRRAEAAREVATAGRAIGSDAAAARRR